MNKQTFQLLLQYQRPSLRTLKIHNYNHDTRMGWEISIPGISSLSINNMDNSGASYAVKNLILENPRVLKHLCLGAEDAAVRDAHDPGYSMRPEVNLNVQKLVDDIEIDYDDYNRREAANDWEKDYRKLKQRGPFANPWLHLDSCELKCLDVSRLIRPSFTLTLLDVNSLTSLNLVSCWGLETAFEFLIGQGHMQEQSTLKLRSFAIRHETSDTTFRSRLMDFIRFLPGLTIYQYFLRPLRRRRMILRLFWIGTDGICDRSFGTKEMQTYAPLRLRAHGLRMSSALALTS